MPHLILPPRYTSDSIRMAAAADRAGWGVTRLAGWRIPESWYASNADEVVIYGEPLFAEVVAPQLGVQLLEPSGDWLARLPGSWRKRDLRNATLREALTIREPTFIKPPGSKDFPAGVYVPGQLIPGAEVLPPDTAVTLAEPVEWRIEWRCVVLDRAVVTRSVYLRNGDLARVEDDWPATADEQAACDAFCRSLLDDPAVDLPRSVVMDVGEIVGRGWAAIELNAVWGSGLYGCDADAMLPALHAAVIRG